MQVREDASELDFHKLLCTVVKEERERQSSEDSSSLMKDNCIDERDFSESYEKSCSIPCERDEDLENTYTEEMSEHYEASMPLEGN